MLHRETVSDATWELLTKLMLNPALDNFVLVGGTALSLQIGHRISIDLDFFTISPFDWQLLAERLTVDWGFSTDWGATNTLKGEMNGVRVEFICHQYPWLSSPQIIEGARIASLEDIAAMKLNAIVGNGTRIKDFIDIAYLNHHLSFNAMLNAYEQKYKANALIAIKSVTYYDDINHNEPLQMFRKPYKWKNIEERIQWMLNNSSLFYNS